MTVSATRGSAQATAFAPTAVAAVAAISAALRAPIALGVSVCLVACVVLLPVWWGALREFRWARTIIVLGVIATAWGAVLSLSDHVRDVSFRMMLNQSIVMISFVGSIGLLLWCRREIGIAQTAVWFGVGCVLNVMWTGVDPDNPWKYSLAMPVAILALGLVNLFKNRLVDVTTLLVLAVISGLSDSRTLIGVFLLAAAIVALQMITRERKKSVRPWQMLVVIGFLSLAAFNLFQALLLDGTLGEVAKERTQSQIDTSGSLLTGARPEIGASVALIGARPWGYGTGTSPDSSDIWTAKAGMSRLNYDPDNGYVDRFMFGGRFELHSILGDIWVSFGPPGAVLILLVMGIGVYSLARSVPRRVAFGIIGLLVLRGLWDTFFSPAGPSFRTLALMCALTALPVIDTKGREVLAIVNGRRSPVEP